MRVVLAVRTHQEEIGLTDFAWWMATLDKENLSESARELLAWVGLLYHLAGERLPVEATCDFEHLMAAVQHAVSAKLDHDCREQTTHVRRFIARYLWSELAEFKREQQACWEAEQESVKKRIAGVPPALSRGDFDTAESTDMDAVDCTVFAPTSLARGHSILIQVFAHMPSQDAEAQATAMEYDSDARRRGRTSLGTNLRLGSTLAFELGFDCPDVHVDSPIEELRWCRRPESVQFSVSADESALLGTRIGTLRISQESVPIGRIKFRLSVTTPEEKAGAIGSPTGEATRFGLAFVSYASEDRAKVWPRVQMLSRVGVRFFQDVLDLEPGVRWERELFRHIDNSDVFYLFWSSAAKSSPWVAKEWKYAIEKHGDEVVQPVVIEGPPIPEPPPELAHVHFNDKFLYFIQGETEGER